MGRKKIIDDRSEYMCEYRQKNREKIAANAKIKINCELCGLEYSKSCKTYHFKSKIHKLGIITKNMYDAEFKKKINSIQNLLN